MAYVGGGLGEIQQLRVELQQIRDMINELEPHLERMPRQLATFRQLERVALRYLVLSKRMGLPEDVDKAINFLVRLITVARMAQVSISLLEMSNPVTFALGVAGLAGASISLVDSFAGY